MIKFISIVIVILTGGLVYKQYKGNKFVISVLLALEIIALVGVLIAMPNDLCILKETFWPVKLEVRYEYMDSDYNKHELNSASTLGHDDSYRIIITKEQDAYISILQKDHVTNECHLLYPNSSGKMKDGVNYIPNGIEYFRFQKSEQSGKKTLFVRATSCSEDDPKLLKDCPLQNKCTDCVSSQTFYFE